jgi:hypothetical protein
MFIYVLNQEISLGDWRNISNYSKFQTGEIVLVLAVRA